VVKKISVIFATLFFKMELINDQYQIQGLDVAAICKEFGTPLYVYDGQKIISQLKQLQKAFAGCDIKVKFAAKALTNLSILKLLKKNGSGIDVVSINEAKLAMKAGFEAGEIMFTSNCIDIREVVEGVELGLNINLDNLSILQKFGEKYGNTYPCCLRLNPGILAGGNYKISTGHKLSKFGIPIEQLAEINRLIDHYKIRVNGLHIHTGSDISDKDVFMKMADVLFDWAKQFPDVEFLDFGGGFKVAYKDGDKMADIDAIGSELEKRFAQFQKETGRKLQMWAEPGKYIVSESGYLFAKTNVVKKNPAITFVGVDSGLNHLIRPMMYDAYHEIVNTSNPTGLLHIYTIVGNVCETDTLGADRQLNEVREGDLIVMKNAGAYGYSMASNYNSRSRPAEVLVLNGKAQLIRKRDTLEDIMRNQVVVDF
jgi:diaminopimelate decarboxylase